MIEEGKTGSSPVPVKTVTEEKKQEELAAKAPEPVKQEEPTGQMTMPLTTEPAPQKTEEKGYTEPDPRIPKALRDLMIKDQVMSGTSRAYAKQRLCPLWDGTVGIRYRKPWNCGRPSGAMLAAGKGCNRCNVKQ